MSFFRRLIEASPSRGVAIGKLVVFAVAALLLTVFVVGHAYQSGDLKPIVGACAILCFGFWVLFATELHMMRR